MYQVLVATFTSVATPCVASVLLPVDPTPAQITVVPDDCAIVVADVAMIKIAVPTGSGTAVLVGTVIVPDP